MKRSFRLKSTKDFQRVRRFGKSYAHPLLVLVALPNPGEQVKFGIAASRAVGNAVERNRAKRLVREATRSIIPLMQPGWQVIIYCRRPLHSSTLPAIIHTLRKLGDQAGMLKHEDGK